MERPCDFCGKPYEAKRPSSRFCSPNCRVRNAGKPKAAADVPIIKTPQANLNLVEIIRRDLEAVGRLDTVLGQQALAIAIRLASPHETGASVATMSRELRAVMVEAMKGVAVAADGVDEVKARRDAKLARFAG